MRNAKVFISVVIALVLSFLGFSKAGLISENSLPTKDGDGKLSLSETNEENICSLEDEEKNNSLFVSCAGFLE